jgi:hypothetical protein
MLDSQIPPKSRDSRWTFADKMYVQTSKNLSESMRSEYPQSATEIKELAGDRVARLRELLKGIDESTIVREMALTLLPAAWISNRTQFCTSREWMAWHHLRLSLAVQRDYVYLRQKGGDPSNCLAEHDDQDVEYVLLLSRADAIITRDKKLVGPLARAAFPEKDVFSSLEEVPESYRCDWTSP